MASDSASCEACGTRACAPGHQRNGRPWKTCCRGCATDGRHDAACDARQQQQQQQPELARKRKREEPAVVRTFSNVLVMSWNAAHVLPESGTNKKKLEETVALLPQQPDLIFVQEMHFYKRTGGAIDSAKSQSKLAAVRELLNGYDLHVAERAPSEDHEFVKGAGVFVRRGGRLTGGRFWQPPWDSDGHVCCWETSAGLLVGGYLPTPTAKMRPDGRSQASVREEVDRRLSELLQSHERQGQLIALLGDLNVTLDNALDTTRPFSGGVYEAARRRFVRLMDDCALMDVWRERNKAVRDKFTSFQQRGAGGGGPRLARVDLALVPRRLAADVVRVDILDEDGTFTTAGYTQAARSDHVPILLELRVST